MTIDSFIVSNHAPGLISPARHLFCASFRFRGVNHGMQACHINVISDSFTLDYATVIPVVVLLLILSPIWMVGAQACTDCILLVVRRDLFLGVQDQFVVKALPTSSSLERVYSSM